jgi:hypothetical protein
MATFSHNLTVPARRNLLPAALIALAFLLFSWSLFPWIPGRSVILSADVLKLVPPWKEAGAPVVQKTLTDPLWVFYPWQREFRSAILSGRFPLWDPTIRCGAPLAANPICALFFPLTWLVIPFGTAAGLSLQATLRPALAAFFMFLYLRRSRFGPLPSLFGALTFGFSLPFLVWVEHPQDNVFLLFPLLCLAGDSIIRQGSVRGAAVLALLGALFVLAGHPESALHAALFGVAYAAVQIARCAKRHSPGPAAGRLLAAAAGAVVLSLFASYPYLVTVQESTAWRTGHSAFAPPPRALLLAIFPNFFGNPSRGLPTAGIPTNFNESALYLGILALSLLPVAFLARRRVRPLPSAGFWGAVLLAVALLLFVGPHVTGFSAIPLLGKIFHTRLSVLAGFAAGVLAAEALDSLSSRRELRVWLFSLLGFLTLSLAIGALAHSPYPQRRDLWWAALLLLGACVLAVRQLSPALRVGGLCLLQALDLWHAGAGYHTVVARSEVFPEAPVLSLARRELSGGRLLGLGVTFPPNSASVYGLRDVRGYDAVESESYLEARRNLALWNKKPGLPEMTAGGLSPQSSQLFPLFAVRLLMLPPGLQVSPEAASRLNLRLALLSRGGATLYRVRDTPGRAQAISVVTPARAQIPPGEDAATDYRKVSEVSGIPEARGFPAAADARLEMAADDPETVKITARSPGDFFLRLSDAYAPGWRAQLDGRPTRLYRCDAAFRGVFVPAGVHEIEMHYRLPGFPLTGIVSLATAIFLIGILLRRRGV